MRTFTAFTKRAENLLERLKLGLPGAMLVHTTIACAESTTSAIFGNSITLINSNKIQ